MRAVLILAAVVATGACALAATVRTASETFVTNKVAEVRAQVDVAAAASTNYVDSLAAYLAQYIGQDGKMNASGYKVPWGYGGYIEFIGDSIHFYHPSVHGQSGVDKTISIPVSDGTFALVADIQNAIGGLAPKTVQRVFADGTTNQVGVVRSNADLVIREVETANGQKQFRLILKTN